MTTETRRSRRIGAGWRRWAREYVAALMLTAGLVAAPPEGRAPRPVAIVRLRHRASDDPFDPRERIGDRLVLTVPATPETLAGRTDERLPFGLN